jgi:hypothetical protein
LKLPLGLAFGLIIVVNRPLLAERGNLQLSAFDPSWLIRTNSI